MKQLQNLDLRSLLSDLRAKFFIESEKGDYAFEYYTDRFLGDDPQNPVLARAYRLHDRKRGSTMKSPWDKFDLDKQEQLLSILLDDGRWRIDRIVTGWRVTCAKCNEELRGEIWEPVPARCPNASGRKCNAILNTEAVEEIEMQ